MNVTDKRYQIYFGFEPHDTLKVTRLAPKKLKYACCNSINVKSITYLQNLLQYEGELLARKIVG